MKKFFILALLFSGFLFSGILSAHNGLLDNNSFNKKKELKKQVLLESKRLFAEGDGSFKEGTLAVSLGYGAISGGFLKILLKEYEDESGYNFSSLGPIHFRGEYGLSDNLGLVLSINHNSWKASWTHTDTSNAAILHHDQFKRSVTSILARINIHFGNTDRLDPYWGVGAGYRMVDYSFTSTDTGYDTSFKSPFNVGFETTLGFRYYIVEGFGLYAELGLAQSIIQGGLAVAF